MAEAELLVDLDSAGRQESGPPIDPADIEDLRWYLEDYLQTPFGVYSDRGDRIAGQLAAWGGALFAAALGTVTLAAAEGAGDGPREPEEIVLRSREPERLALPWELMRAPGATQPLVLAGTGITRCLAATSPPDEPVNASGDRLRVLMVISRPASVRDVGYQMIARPLLRSMASVPGPVDLEVLRPPTLEALAARLMQARDAGAPFQVVHFDGHGVAANEGALIFERPGGGVDYVSAARLAGVLAGADVPVAVLNACQSGAIGKRLEAAVATGLLAGGVAAVVAMSYRVYVVAAAEFMTAFYDRLLRGGTIGEAVRAGRARMARHPGRPSPKGELPLADWVVPVYYRRREVRFPQLRVASPAGPRAGSEAAAPEAATPEAGDSCVVDSDEGDPFAQEDEFVGRDDLFCTLETAARTDRVLVLHGPGGTGKTEVAKAFGRWWRDTGGVDRRGGLFWHSFEPGITAHGLDSAVLKIGLGLLGPQFALPDPGVRRDLVLEQLREHRLLLVWDNFESVAAMPGEHAQPLGEAGRSQLREFLHEAAQGQSTILITSRTTEGWLGEVRRVAVAGLLPHEAVEYANRLLAPFPAAVPRRADREFARLLEWLDGHPLSMRLILPHVGTTEPATLLEALRGMRSLPVTEPEPATAERDTAGLDVSRPDGIDAEARARMRSLSASVGYSVVHLSPSGRRLLVALSLLTGVADPELLGALSAQEEAPPRLVGVSAGEWDTVLDEAASVGLLTSRPTGGYGIHPALPAYLAAQWRSEEPAIYAGARAAAEDALLRACAATSDHWGEDMDAGGIAAAQAFIDRNRGTMSRMLGYALDNRRWAEAGPIFIPLYQYLNRGGMDEEARGWAGRVRRAVEGPTGASPAAGLPKLTQVPDSSALSPEAAREYREAVARWIDATPALSLWTSAVQAQAQRLSRAGDVDAAEERYRAILDVQQSHPKFPRSGLASSYTELGQVAEHRGQPADAEKMYRQALAIQEEAGDQRSVAALHRQLGRVAYGRGRWDEAEARYRRALAILKEEAGASQSTQLIYNALGQLAESRGRLTEAEEWFAEALSLGEQLHDWDKTASSLHSLGRLSRKRGQLAEAERWYRRCLTLAEGVHDRPGMAAVYHELGLVALMRGQDESEDWFRRSLAIHQELGDRQSIARDYRELGIIAMARHQPDEARRLWLESLAIAQAIAQQETVTECCYLLGALACQQKQWNEAERWLRDSLAHQEKTGSEVGVAMCCQHLAMLADARDDGRADPAEALAWAVRSLTLISRYPQIADRRTIGQVLSNVTRRLGIGAVAEQWLHQTGEPLPDDVRRLAQPDQDDDNPARKDQPADEER